MLKDTDERGGMREMDDIDARARLCPTRDVCEAHVGYEIPLK